MGQSGGWARHSVSLFPFPAVAHLSRCACSCGEHSPHGRNSRSRPGGCGSGGRRWGPLLGAPGTRQCLGEGQAGRQQERRRDITEPRHGLRGPQPHSCPERSLLRNGGDSCPAKCQSQTKVTVAFLQQVEGDLNFILFKPMKVKRPAPRNQASTGSSLQGNPVGRPLYRFH